MRTSLLFAAALLAGCGSSPAEQPGSDGGGQTDGPGGGGNADLTTGGGTDGAVANNYPAGPYGNNVGDTFPPLVWEGYVDEAADALASTKTYGPYSADAVRKSGRTYALVHVSEFF